MTPGSTKSDEAWVFRETQADDSLARKSPVVVRDSSPYEDDDETEIELPERVGRFQIVRLLGRGAMGTVLEGHDETLDRKVAVKLLHQDSGRHHHKRLLREAQALARLKHDNVVAVYDAGEHQGQLYIAMELVEGQTLWDWHKTPHPWTDCLRVYLEAGRGLMAAHAEGIVHRDFKPANCIVEPQGRVKVLDFGLARGVDDDELSVDRGSTSDEDLLAEPLRPAPEPQMSALSLRLTRTGAMLGTPAYMAPEQASGMPTDARCDQFSFCVALYEALHGERPFAGNPGLALAAGHEPSFDTKTPAGLPAVPGWLKAVLRRGLSAKREDRFATMDDLLAAIERGRRRRRWLALGVVGVGLVAASSALFAARSEPCEGIRNAPMAAWGQTQRSAVRDALLATASEHAAGAWEATAAGLDEYSTAWSDARAQACEATRVEQVAGEDLLELRMACLDRHAIQVAATVELLSGADDSMATRAAQVVRSLPAVDRCLDAERLRSTPALPAELAEPAREIREQVARSWAFDAAGQARRGLDAAEDAITGAQALGPGGAPLEAEARLNRGRLYRSVRRLTDARDDLQGVLRHAEQTHDHTLALDALRELLMVAQEERDGSAFGAWMTVARGKLGARTDEPHAEAQISYLEGLQALRDDDLAGATERLTAAVTQYQQLGSGTSLDTGRALLQLGVAQARDKQDAQAEQIFEQAQALAEGEGLLPLLADVFLERGRLLFDRGRHEEAERWLERSLELRVGFDGPTAPVTIPPRVLLTILLQQRGEQDAALAMVDVVRESLGPDVPARTRVQVMYLLARIHRQKGDWEAALDDYRQAEEAMAAQASPDPLAQAMLHSNVADCLRVLGRHVAARMRYEQAIDGIRIHAPPREKYRSVYPLYGLASLADEQRDMVGARELYRRALSVPGAVARDPDVGAMLHWKLARSMLQGPPVPQPELQQAKEHLREARRRYQALGDAGMIAEIDAFRDGCGARCSIEGPGSR